MRTYFILPLLLVCLIWWVTSLCAEFTICGVKKHDRIGARINGEGCSIYNIPLCFKKNRIQGNASFVLELLQWRKMHVAI